MSLAESMFLRVLLVFAVAGALLTRCHGQVSFDDYYFASDGTYAGSVTTTGTYKLVVGANLPTGDYYFCADTWGNFLWSVHHIAGTGNTRTGTLTGGIPSYSMNIKVSSDYGTTLATVGHLSNVYTSHYDASAYKGNVTNSIGLFGSFAAPGSAVPNSLKLHIPVKSDGNKAHTVVIQKIDGETGEVTVLGTINETVGAPSTQFVDASPDWKLGDKLVTLVDGKSLGTVDPTQGISFPVEQIGSVIQAGGVSVNLQDDPVPGAAAPAPTTTQTNGGNETTTTTAPDGTKTIHTTLNNGGTTISGSTTGATTQDIYEAVKAAVTDSGNSSTGSTSAVTFDAGGAIQGTTGNDVQNAQASLNGVKASYSGLVGTGSALASTITAVDMPTSVGKVWSRSIVLPMFGAQVLDWSAYATQINAFRLLCLVCTTMLIWFLCIRTVKSAID